MSDNSDKNKEMSDKINNTIKLNIFLINLPS